MSCAERAANAWHQRAAASKPLSELTAMNHQPLTRVGAAGVHPAYKTAHLAPSFHQQGDASLNCRFPRRFLIGDVHPVQQSKRDHSYHRPTDKGYCRIERFP